MSEGESPPPIEGILIKVPTEASSKRSGKEGVIHPAINPPTAGNKQLRNDNYTSEINPAAVGCKRLPINTSCADESHEPNVTASVNVSESPSTLQRKTGR